MDQKLQQFITTHADSDPTALMLRKKQFPDIDMETAVRCILGRKKIAAKLPDWLRFPDLLFPATLSLEQSSSQATAAYKQRFVSEDHRVADLTGGFGADSFYLSRKAAKVDYFERNGELTDCVRENFRTMSGDNITVRNCEVTAEVLASMPADTYDLIYLDPARRGKAGQRVFSISDCEPDVSLLKDELLRIAPRVLVKVSPMADISALHAIFPEAVEFHVLSVHNECKEVLMLLERNCPEQKKQGQAAELPIEPKIVAVELENESGDVREQEEACRVQCEFAFTQSGERCAVPQMAARGEIGGFLYEPYACMTKAGAFKLPAVRFGVNKVAQDTHLYIGAGVLDGFPGRVRRIEAVYDINKEFMRSFRKSVPECSVTARNLKMTSEELSGRLGTKESSTRRLFAVTAADGSKIGILTNSSLD